MILLQSGIALGLLFLIILVVLIILLILFVFIRSDNHIIKLIERGNSVSLKQKVSIIFRNLLYYLAFALPLIAIIYWFFKDIVIM